MKQITRGNSFRTGRWYMTCAKRVKRTQNPQIDNLSFRIAKHRDGYQVMRGSSIWTHQRFTRCAVRLYLLPHFEETGIGSGFRVSRRKT